MDIIMKNQVRAAEGLLGISDGISLNSVFSLLLKGKTFIKTQTTGGDGMQQTGMSDLC